MDNKDKDYAQISCDILRSVADMGIMNDTDKEKIYKAISVLMYSRMFEDKKAYWMSKRESDALDSFRKKYNHDELTTGVTVSFTPTGIGNIVTVRCPYCNKEEDITDISSW